MPAAEEWIGPLHENNASAGGARDRCAHSRQPLLIGEDQRFCFLFTADRASHADNVVFYLPDVSRSKKEHFRLQTELPHGASQLVPRGSTHPTEILREYHVGTQVAEK